MSTQSHQTHYYGPMSYFYFIGQISSFLCIAFQQPPSNHNLQPNSASRSFASPISSSGSSLDESHIIEESPSNGDYLTRTQEEYFLGLFWQSYHCTLQILDEADFREHYKSLWTAPGTPRKQSALVDIVLAICMQYGVAFIPRNDENSEPKVDVDSNDATIAGRWYYRRSQTLLAQELESPSLATVQYHIIALIYLCNASFQNMAHSTSALAVRTAQILGLHLEPPEDIPSAQRALRRRLWWNLYAVEVKTCMKLGRPSSVQMSRVTCALPADDSEAALISGSNFSSLDENSTWLTYGSQHIKLFLEASAIYNAFGEKYEEMLCLSDGKSISNDPQSLEACAEFLLSSMKCLQDWRHNVPDLLKTRRKGSGDPFSTDRSALDIELFAPLWLQRQQLILELLYHNQAMNLHRPFIRFAPASDFCTPLAEGNAISCVNHAIAITHIIHQVLAETDILNGWHEAFQWQWNAALSMIGFILAYPMSPSTVSTRKAINSAIASFKVFGNNFAIAASAAIVTRDLTAKADILIDRFRSSLTRPGPAFPGDVSILQSNDSDPNRVETPDNHGNVGESSLADSMGLAFTIDSFNSFEPFNGNTFDMWTFTQDSGS